MKTTKPARVQSVSADVADRVASRMLDTEPPRMGYFAYTGETYRKVCGMSAEESVIDDTIAAAKKRLAVLREGFRLGAADFVAGLKRQPDHLETAGDPHAGLLTYGAGGRGAAIALWAHFCNLPGEGPPHEAIRATANREHSELVDACPLAKV